MLDLKLRLSFGLALLLALAPASVADAQDAPPRQQVVGRNSELVAAFGDVARSASRHVVRLEENGRARGFGVIIDGGFVLTSAQVTSGRRALTAVSAAGPLSVSLHATDEANDLALLRIGGAAPEGMPFGKMIDVQIGQFLIVVGIDPQPLSVGVLSAKQRVVEPSGQEQNILMGLLSDGNEGHKRAYPSVLQHDGPTSSDVFGAPVVDRKGRLVGISVAAPYRGSSHAVDVDQIATVLDGLKGGASTAAPAAARRARLGVACIDAPPEALGDATAGLFVREVQGPAAEAGLLPKDVIIELDGAPVTTMDAFAREIARRRPGDVVKVKVLRGGAREQLELPVTLGEAPR
jgi:S1-C subfamily serine protease